MCDIHLVAVLNAIKYFMYPKFPSLFTFLRFSHIRQCYEITQG